MLLEFLEVLIKYTGGYFSPNALQRLIRAISFLCAAHSTYPDWMENNLPMPASDPSSELFAFKLLKDLIWAVVARTESVESIQFLPESQSWSDDLLKFDIKIDNNNNDDNENENEATKIVQNLCCDFIDDIIDSVEIAKISEIVLLNISRANTLPTSNKFWHQILMSSKKLFPHTEYRNVFLILAALCKMARLEIREGTQKARDMGNKLISLEAIVELCANASDYLATSKVMGYQIRRLVVPCILSNVSYAFSDTRIFSKVIFFLQ
jgi:hypothetical protein